MNETINEFVADHVKSISDFDLHQYASAISSVVTEGVVTAMYSAKIIDVNPALYTEYLAKTMNNMDTITANAEELDEFFSNTYNSLPLSNKKITVPMHAEEDISKIRPEYLTTFAQEADGLLKKIIGGNTPFDVVKKIFTDGAYLTKNKKRLVKTSLVINDTRDLMVMDSPSLVVVDSMYIEHNMIPFVRTYPTSVDDLKNVSINCISEMNNAARLLNISFNAARTVITSGKASGNVVRTLEYATVSIHRMFMELCAYISGMCIRKLSYYSFNIKSCLNLYNVIHASFPEMDRILHESVLDGRLDDIDDADLFYSAVDSELGIIRPHIQNAVQMKVNELTNLIANRYGQKITSVSDIDIDKYPYDKSVYDKVNGTFIEISQMLQAFEKGIVSEDFVVDDVLNDSHLNETFISRYSNVLVVFEDTSKYTGEESAEAVFTLLNEVYNYESNVEKIIRNMGVIFGFLEKYQGMIEDNTSQYDTATYNELVSVLDVIMNNYKDYVLLVAKKIISRLDNLTDALEENDIETFESELDEDSAPYDYTAEMVVSKIDNTLDNARLLMESMNREFQIARAKEYRGTDVVFEADDAQNNTPSTNNSKPSATPPVDVKTDISAKANTPDKDNTNSTTPKPATGNTKENTSGIIAAFKDFIQKILDKFSKKGKSLSSKFNYWMGMSDDRTGNKPLKEYITNLDYSKTTINLASYSKFGIEDTGVITDIGTAMNNINAITASPLPPEFTNPKGRGAIEKKIFSMIPATNTWKDADRVYGNDANSFRSRIKGYYIYDSDGAAKSITGEDVKNAVSAMINYCENYSKFTSKIQDKINALEDTAAKKQDEIIKSDNGSNKTEEDKTPTPAANDDNNKDKVVPNNVITNITKDYCGAILSVAEVKYINYLNYLKKFSPIPYTDAKSTAAQVQEKLSNKENNK